MDNYIIRIYRREKDNPRMLVGLIEEVGSKGKKAFTTLDDLWEILNRPAQSKHTESAKTRNKRRTAAGNRDE